MHTEEERAYYEFTLALTDPESMVYALLLLLLLLLSRMRKLVLQLCVTKETHRLQLERDSSMFNQDIWRKVVTLPHALSVFSNCEGPK